MPEPFQTGKSDTSFRPPNTPEASVKFEVGYHPSFNYVLAGDMLCRKYNAGKCSDQSAQSCTTVTRQQKKLALVHKCSFVTSRNVLCGQRHSGKDHK